MRGSGSGVEHDGVVFRSGDVALALLLCVLLTPMGGAKARAADPVGTRRTTLGRSVGGRPILAFETGDLDATKHVLIVGCIHGNEPAGIAIARRLIRLHPAREVDLVIVPVLNPDGVAAGTRGNAHGVDLNRNFPWHWRRLSGVFDSGYRPLSEPESKVAARLIMEIRPRISIWFHQHMNLVDESGGDVRLERRFAALTHMRYARLAREPGSVVGWENHRFRGTTAFVVELAAGSLRAEAAQRYARAVVALSR